MMQMAGAFVAILMQAPMMQSASRPVTPAVPRHPLHALVSVEDYPAFARRYELEGQTSVALAIDAAGRVDGCAVVQSSGHAILDGATCGLMTRRARFTPARDRAGRAVRDTYRTSFRWSLGPRPVVVAPTT